MTPKLNKINSKTLAEHLSKLMRGLNLNETELARQAKLPQPTVHKLLTRKTIDPRYSTLKALGFFFQITIDELATGIKPIQYSESIQKIPILTWHDCTRNPKWIKKLNPQNWPDWIITETTLSNCYALISKPSMMPRFELGTKLIIAPTIQPNDGDLIITQYPDTEEATLRQLSIDGPNKLLLPINPHLKPETCTAEIKIHGKVIESRVSFP